MSAPAAAERLCRARRVLVLGPSGAGKTHLALRLAAVTGLPLVHLDAERWQPGWIALGDNEWRAAVRALAARPSWIMDGTYESTLDLRLPRAEAVIVLERSRAACLLGLLRRRVLVRGGQRVDAPAGQRLDRAFLRYLWRWPAVTRPVVDAHLRAHAADEAVVRLRGRRAARRLLEQVRGQRSAEAGVAPATART
jgi:adenylate kinase family enzyme